MQIIKSILYNFALAVFSLFLARSIKQFELHFGFQGFLSLESIGVILLIIGFMVRVYCAYLYYKNDLEVFAVNSQKILIKKFPFNISRNPLYFGLILYAVGSSMFFNSVASLVGAILFVIFLHVYIIKFEEKDLEKRFGKNYYDYKKSVRRWI